MMAHAFPADPTLEALLVLLTRSSDFGTPLVGGWEWPLE
jgi:hypothetical protein